MDTEHVGLAEQSIRAALADARNSFGIAIGGTKVDMIALKNAHAQFVISVLLEELRRRDLERADMVTSWITQAMEDGDTIHELVGEWLARILIMSLRSGAGLDGLQMGCDTGVIGELDWSPQVSHQCIGRLARDGIDHPPTAYFCVSDHGADPPMIEVLDIKRMQNDPMVNPRLDLVQPVQQNTNHVIALAQSLVSGHIHRPTTIPAGTAEQPALPFEVAS